MMKYKSKNMFVGFTKIDQGFQINDLLLQIIIFIYNNKLTYPKRN